MPSVGDIETIWGGLEDPIRIEIMGTRGVTVTYSSGRRVKFFYNRTASELGRISLRGRKLEGVDETLQLGGSD